MKTYYKAIEELAKEFIEYMKENEAEIKEDELDEELYEFLDMKWYNFLRDEWCDDVKTEFLAAAKVLEESENVNDYELWEGKELREAVIEQAFFTVLNDLKEEVKKQLEN